MIVEHEAPIKTEIFSIRTRDLSLWYGDFQALKGVTVNIKQGMVTSLIGPSGCGKTTLLRCFNRINERYGNEAAQQRRDRKSTRLNSSHGSISYAVFCLKKKKTKRTHDPS